MTRTPAQEVAYRAQKARDALAARDEAIRAMRDTGASLRAIADAAELTHSGIARILART